MLGTTIYKSLIGALSALGDVAKDFKPNEPFAILPARKEF